MNSFFDWSIRKFAAHFGVAQETVFILWLHIQTHDSDGIFQLKHLFWTLYFLKVYSSVDVCASFWKVSPKTYSHWTWRLIFFFDLTLNIVSIFIN
jgi:hypothetical protein